MQKFDIHIIRSPRRRKTIQARQREGRIEILAPARMSDRQLQPHIDQLVKRFHQRQACASLDATDLEQRARALNRKYFRGTLTWQSIDWVDNQQQQYGSCQPSTGILRISHRLGQMPRFVLDYVIMHELAHLREPNHSRRFWALVNQYPKTERARGYLMAVGLEKVSDAPELETACPPLNV